MLHVVQFFPGEIPPRAYGGIERVVFWLTRELLAQGCRVSLIAAPESHISTICPEVNFIPYLGASTDYRRLIPQDADVVHLHHSPTQEELPDIPFLVTEHGNRKGAEQVQNTVFISRSHARAHNSEHFVYNGIPLDEYPFCPEKNDSLLFMAKLGWRVKNAKTAINLAFDTGTPLALAGGDLFSARKIRGSWLLKWPFKGELIEQVGEIGGVEKLRYLQQSMLLFYIVNWSEPFALAPHEALACGTPVIASPNGALAEYIEHGRNGYLVRTYDEAVEVLRLHKSLTATEIKSMAQECRTSAFTIQDCAEGYLKYYERVQKGDLYSEAELGRVRFRRPDVLKVRKVFG